MADVDVVILGAGLSGIGLGIQLLATGRRSFVILEQADDVGGTWRDNRYPGAGCDTESHLYCFSFGLNPGVSRVYARQPEIKRYADRLVAEHDLGRFIRFGSEVVGASWDGAGRFWRITIADGRVVTGRSFVAAWGQLNRPQIPDFPGRDGFAGRSFHTARWPDAIDLAGLRVATVGNAASAVQVVPEIVDAVGHLSVFQRSPNWIVPRLDRAYTEDERAGWVARPDIFAEDRAALFAWRESTFTRMNTGSDAAHELEAIAQAHLAAQIADPVLRARLTPDYPAGCKRILRSDDYYPALTRRHVSLVTEAIAAIEPAGIVTADGVLHPLDVIIYATGFETQSFQGPVEILGAGDADLRRSWRDGASAFLGLTVPGFPNFFMLYGPNTNLGHNSILTMLEAQFAYIIQALDLLERHPGAALELHERSLERFDAALRAQMAGRAWAGNCASWYKNAAGKIINNWSSSVEDYQAMTARLDPEDYRLTGAA